MLVQEGGVLLRQRLGGRKEEHPSPVEPLQHHPERDNGLAEAGGEYHQRRGAQARRGDSDLVFAFVEWRPFEQRVVREAHACGPSHPLRQK